MSLKRFGNIAVLAGGPSSEREISLRSGKEVFDALKIQGYSVALIDLPDNIEDIQGVAKMDLAFIALHGRFGEDGTIQNMLEKMRVPYTGSGPAASRRAFDKCESKRLFAKADVPTPQYVKLYEKIPVEKLGIRLPVVVKPSREGSSVGLSIVRVPDDFESALEKAFEFCDNILVESYISGRELTVGILEERPLPVVEISAKDSVYDFSAKYNDENTSYTVPAMLDDRVTHNVQSVALLAHMSLGCKDFSRVDIRLDRDNNPYVLEVNTIPGMTGRSLFPKAALADGIPFVELCVKMMELALK